MPSPLQILAFSIEPRSSRSGAGSSISLGAIVGIAIGGSVALFVMLAIPLLRLAKWQDRRKGLLGGPEPDAMERDTSERKPPQSPRRLQKKRTRGRQHSQAGATQNKHWSLPVLPPLFSRRESLNLGPFSEDGPLTPERSQRREKQRGQALSRMRRQSSWIDEDSLHGPRVCKPPNGRNRGRLSWLGNPLRRTLQIKRPLSDTWLFRSPTIPHMEQGIGFADVDEWLRDAHQTSYDAPVPDPSAMRLYHAALPPSLTMPVPRPPSAVIHNPRQRNTTVLEAAQQLAGNARLPSSQQPPVAKTAVADVELTEILRMTAARLQDGSRSSRRQTTMAITGLSKDAMGVPRLCNTATTDSMPGSEAVSPTKSQKSAPAVMMCAELEAIEASPVRKPQPEQQPYGTQHGRDISQVSHISFVSSVASEPDSLVGGRWVSQPEVQTALSSPSRHIRAKEVLTGAEPKLHSQPISHRSSRSSALSTLYSEDEEPERSRARSSRHDSLMERCTVIEGLPVDPGTVFPRPPWDGRKDIQSLRTERGTSGPVSSLQSWRQAQGTAPLTVPELKPPTKTMVQCSISGVDDDPFVANTSPSRKKARFSQVFSPIPPAEDGKRCEAATETTPVVRVIKLTQTATPTPPSHSQRVFPPPHGPRPKTSSPTLGVRRPGSASPEGDVSATSNGGGEDDETTTLHGPARLVTIQSIENSPTKPRPWKSVPGGDKPFRSPGAGRADLIPRSQREGSPESTYSQDTLGPLHVNNRDSCQVAMAVAELRRMNSQVSCVSGHSNATAEMGSPTLPALRGGGFSPGKKGGGVRNYLAVGTLLGSSPERTSYDSKGAAPLVRRGTNKRRGTVTSAGPNERLEALEKLREVLRDRDGVSPVQ